jgi:soluble lytic murein transglycosylase-like protein
MSGGKIVGAVMVLAGVSYLVFRASPANASPGAGAILYPEDNVPIRRRAGGRLDPQEALQIVNSVNASEGLGLDPGDVLAVIAVESSFDPAAYRFEAKLNDASYGLMQILYSTARDVGYSGEPAGLYDPETNVLFGMRYIRWVQDFLLSRTGREPTFDEWLSAYNGGVGNVLKGWRSLAYVDKWRKARSGIVVA